MMGNEKHKPMWITRWHVAKFLGPREVLEQRISLHAPQLRAHDERLDIVESYVSWRNGEPWGCWRIVDTVELIYIRRDRSRHFAFVSLQLLT